MVKENGKPLLVLIWDDMGTFPDGTRRYRLCHLDADHTWKQTPYFIDRNPRMREGPYTLLGAGMHPAGIALRLDYFKKLAEAKQKGIALYNKDKENDNHA